MSIGINRKMDEKDIERIEVYLAEVVQRLTDTQKALEATLVYCRTRKEGLVGSGKKFDYDQGRIDTAMEVYRYATGEDNLQEIIDLMEKNQQVVRAKMQGAGSPGMESV